MIFKCNLDTATDTLILKNYFIKKRRGPIKTELKKISLQKINLQKDISIELTSRTAL